MKKRPGLTAAGPDPADPAQPLEPEPAVTEAADADQDPGSAMICLIPSPEVAQALAIPGGQSVEQLHVTLLYLGPIAGLEVERGDVEDLIAATLAAMASVGDTDDDAAGLEDGSVGAVDPDEDGDADTNILSGVFNGMARFTADPDKGTPLVTTLDAPGLGLLVDTLGEALRDSIDGLPAPTHGLVPHMTLAWRTDIGPEDPMEIPPPSNLRASWTEVALAWGDVSDPANVTTFPLSGPDPDAGAEVVLAAGEADSVAEPAPASTGRVLPEAGVLGSWIACLATEGVPTDEVMPSPDGTDVIEGRLLPPGIAAFREPPLPGGFAMDDMGNPADKGHAEAPIAFAATKVWRDGAQIMASGPYLDNAAGAAAKAAIDSGAPVAPSIVFAGAEYSIALDGSGRSTMSLVRGTITGFCVLPFEAMHAAQSDGTWLSWVRSVPGSEVQDAVVASAFGLPEAVEAPQQRSLPYLTASGSCGCDDPGAERFGAPLYPPAACFERPSPGVLTPMTVTADAELFGHGTGGTCHIGIPGTCVKPTDGMLDTDFSAFHKGLDGAGRGIETAEGTFVQVGQITLSGGHAHETLSADAARRHYDETRSVIANVRAVWDPAVGAPFYRGSLVYGATKADVQMLRAIGHVSVDYRLLLPDGSVPRRPNERGAKLRLIALPAVPVGGFPPVKAFAASGVLHTVILSPEGDHMDATDTTDTTAVPADTATETPTAGTPPETPPPGTLPYIPQPYDKLSGESATCMTCGRANDADASWCDQCGAPMTPTEAYAADDSDTIACPVDGAMNAPDAAYCDQDGTMLIGRKDVGPDGAPASDDSDAIVATDDTTGMAVIGDQGLPVADRDTDWDGEGASQRVATLCTSGGGTLDPACFGRAFLWRDDSQPDTNVGSYKLGFADVINGKLQIVPKGVFAIAARLDQTDIPAADKDRVKARISSLYELMATRFDDPTLVAPWEQGITAAALLGELLLRDYDRTFEAEQERLARVHDAEAQRMDRFMATR